MNLETLTSFFMWCSVINGGLLIYSSLMLILAPEWIYRIQNRWFSIPRKSFNVVIYAYLGLMKILFFVFNLAPYIALRIITSS